MIEYIVQQWVVNIEERPLDEDCYDQAADGSGSCKEISNCICKNSATKYPFSTFALGPVSYFMEKELFYAVLVSSAKLQHFSVAYDLNHTLLMNPT